MRNKLTWFQFVLTVFADLFHQLCPSYPGNTLGKQRIHAKHLSSWCKTKTRYIRYQWLDQNLKLADQYTSLGNCPRTSPLSQHFALSEK